MFLVFTILKNIIMSIILFYCLYRFYVELKRIGLKFTAKKCILTVHILAFGVPIISGVIYLILIANYNQTAVFTSTRATQQYWYVLAPTILFILTMGVVQAMMLYLVTIYSIKAHVHGDPNATR